MKPLVYLAGPMTGHMNHNFEIFDEVASELRDRGLRVINPAEEDRAIGIDGTQPVTKEKGVDCLLRDLRVMRENMDELRALLVLPRWEHSSGVSVEIPFAERVIGVPILKFTDLEPVGQRTIPNPLKGPWKELRPYALKPGPAQARWSEIGEKILRNKFEHDGHDPGPPMNAKATQDPIEECGACGGSGVQPPYCLEGRKCRRCMGVGATGKGISSDTCPVCRGKGGYEGHPACLACLGTGKNASPSRVRQIRERMSPWYSSSSINLTRRER